MRADEYKSNYEDNLYISTTLQIRKDFMYMCSNDLFWIGEYDDYKFERAIAQFFNCTTPGMEVLVGEQFFTRYVGRRVVSTGYESARQICDIPFRRH